MQNARPIAYLLAAIALAGCAATTSAGAAADTTADDDAQISTDAASDSDVAKNDVAISDAALDDTLSADVAGSDAAADAVTDVASQDVPDAAADAVKDQAGADGGPSCSDFTAPPTTSPTSIVVLNNTANNIYLGPPMQNCQFNPGFAVNGPEGEPYVVSLEACAFTCGALQTQGCGCPPVACQPTIVTLVAPGKKVDFGWTGTVFYPDAMPGSCYSDSQCIAKGCFFEAAAITDSTISVDAYTGATCNGAPCSDCTPGASGNCTISGASSTSGAAVTATAVWTGQASVQIVFK